MEERREEQLEEKLIQILSNPEELRRYQRKKRKSDRLKKYSRAILIAREKGLSFRAITELLRKEAKFRVSEATLRRFYREHLKEEELNFLYESITVEQKEKAKAAGKKFEQDYVDFVFVKEALKREYSQEEIETFLKQKRQDKDENYISRTINRATMEIR